MMMQCCAARYQCMSHAAPQREAGSFARFFLNHAMMDTILLVSIFAILRGVTVLLSTRIILAALLAVLVILGVMVQRTQLSPPSGGV